MSQESLKEEKSSKTVGDAPEQFKSRYVLIDVCSVDFLVACLRICTGFKGLSFREMRSSEHFGWTDKIGSHHNVSQKVNRIRRLAEMGVR